MARAQGARAQMAVAFESTFGTAPASGFRRMPFASSDVDGAQDLLANDLLGFGRDPLAPDLDVTNVSGTMGVPVTLNDFGVWLKATFGAPTTTGAAVKTHTFQTGQWALPSVAMEIGMPDVPYFNMVRGLKVNQLTIPFARSGHLRAELGLIGRDEVKDTTTQAGTLGADYTLARFLNRHGAISRAGSPLGNVVSASLTYMNNLDAGEVIGDGGKIGWLDPTMAELQFDLTVRFDSTTLLDQAIGGTAAAFEYTLTRGANETLTFSIPRLFLPHPKKIIEGPQGVQATFNGRAAQQANGDPMMSVVLVNAVTSY